MLDNSNFYLTAYKKHGLSPRGLNWNSKISQDIRFEIITALIQEELPICSIADAGCGFADLYLFWDKNDLHIKKYIGIDSVLNSVNLANKNLKNFSNCTLTCKDILKDALPYADWYIASGSLNILSTFDTWLFLEQMLAYSKKGIVFNILEGEKQSENFNYQTKQHIEKFFHKKDLKIDIISGYLENDMTIRVTK